jgi:hypothetical protein
MRYLLSAALLIGLFSCNQSSNNNQILQNKIDSLQFKLNNIYKPGFGEFMSSIQVHHAKLWFAGSNDNWDLAAFEIKEIKESLVNIETYCTDRPETNSIKMIDAPLESISHAIAQKNRQLFKNDFVLLTNNCNKCHQAINFQYNAVQIPTTPPFANQSF